MLDKFIEYFFITLTIALLALYVICSVLVLAFLAKSFIGW